MDEDILHDLHTNDGAFTAQQIAYIKQEMETHRDTLENPEFLEVAAEAFPLVMRLLATIEFLESDSQWGLN